LSEVQKTNEKFTTCSLVYDLKDFPFERENTLCSSMWRVGVENKA